MALPLRGTRSSLAGARHACKQAKGALLRHTIAPVPLYQIRVHFETDRPEEVDGLIDAFERAICPHRADEEHRCPNRWNIMSAELGAAEAAELDDRLNE
jgi:hypothetical protein